jgi:hypothetical protein
MEELFKRLGVPPEMWIVSFFSSTLFTLYRIYETEVSPSKRKVISMLIMGLVSALIVPGIVLHWLGVTNPSIAGLITGTVVYSFEQVMHAFRGKLLKKINDDDGNPA